MADYEIPEPEPKEIDEKLAIELRHLADNAVLKGKPQGEDRPRRPRDVRARHGGVEVAGLLCMGDRLADREVREPGVDEAEARRQQPWRHQRIEPEPDQRHHEDQQERVTPAEVAAGIEVVERRERDDGPGEVDAAVEEVPEADEPPGREEPPLDRPFVIDAESLLPVADP